MPNKEEIKKKLEAEREALSSEMLAIGTRNAETGEWEAVPEELAVPESDQNDMADRFEDFEARSSMLAVLEGRLQNIDKALEKVGSKDFGLCEVCNKQIEEDRLEANPAATTCKEHLES